MPLMPPPESTRRFRLARGVRLRLDRISGAWVLLSPERGLLLNDSAGEIVTAALSGASLAELTEALAQGHDRQRVAADALELLQELERRGLLEQTELT
jgi:coenzyme PQQ biosynthesis protein PqqD